VLNFAEKHPVQVLVVGLYKVVLATLGVLKAELGRAWGYVSGWLAAWASGCRAQFNFVWEMWCGNFL